MKAAIGSDRFHVGATLLEPRKTKTARFASSNAHSRDRIVAKPSARTTVANVAATGLRGSCNATATRQKSIRAINAWRTTVAGRAKTGLFV